MTSRRCMMIFALVTLAAAIALWAMGRPPFCQCGTLDLWGQVGPQQSQMLADWYSPSHIIHGIIFYALLKRAAPSWSGERRFLAAMLIEAGWELIENTPLIIDRYREATMALGYTGDSIVNSVSDIAMMAAGYWVAGRIPVWASVVLIIVLEMIALAAVRDNLTLNVWMLLFPSDSLKAWQSAG